jgi:HAD superfamily hydrolase (TIGR01509 family)|tara:strand:+ start:24490 stop:25137 length:648 start_codon:yes stop_codon:yes gene_type:complete
MIKAILWDCDNTIIKTAELHFAKHVAVLKRYGIDLDKRFKPTIYSNNSFQNWEILSGAFEIDSTQDQYIADIDAWYQDNIQTLQVRDGVEDVLKAAKAKGIKQAIVSNGREESVMAGIKAKGLMDYFDMILTRNDYTERKPHPEPYLVALKKLDLTATDTIAIEDDPKGAQSAIAAGIPTVHYRFTEGMPPVTTAIYDCYSGEDFSKFMKDKING